MGQTLVMSPTSYMGLSVSVSLGGLCLTKPNNNNNNAGVYRHF
jgi:hypothetical protein